jgi:putative ABC transport system permease protein
MTATLHERPTRKDQHGGAPARRAVVRWSLRLYRRDWRRQALVLALLIVAIAATVVGLGATTNAAALKADPVFGTANTVINVPGSDHDINGDVASLAARFGAVELISHQSVPIPGSVASLDVRAANPDGVYGHVALRLDQGRYPTGPAEVALTTGAAKTFGAKLGGQWEASGRALHVVGLVENPLNLLDEFALVAPGQIGSPSGYSILLNATSHALDSFTLPSHARLSISLRSSASEAAVAAVVLVITTMGLLFVGLVAVAGFAVMAQRRQRALGMLGSLGATDRHLRLVVLANGAAVGATAAVVGAAVGLAGWFAFVPTLQSIVKRRVEPFSLPWWAIGAAMLLTFATAVAAAWWPARAVARMSPIAALSGRPPRPQPAHRFAAVGGVLLSGGIVLLAFADGHRVGFIIGGTLATPVGLLFLAPLGLRLLAAVGRRSTIAVRLALRDLVRYQARSGSALGAITLAVGIAATIAINAAASEKPAGAGNLAVNQLVLHVSRSQPGDPIPSLSASQLRAATAALNDVAATLHATTLPLDEAYDAQSSPVPLAGPGPVSVSPDQTGSGDAQPTGYMTAVLAHVTQRPPHGVGLSDMVPLYVATPEMLARYGIAASHIRADADVITSRTDLAGLQLFNPMNRPKTTHRGDELTRPNIQSLPGLPEGSSAPGTLLTPHAVQAMGLVSLPVGWLLQTTHPLSRSQIDVATQAAARAGLYVETRQPEKSLAPLRNGATGAGILLALGVLAMTVGLIRSETSGDVRTLTATGASGRTRRTLTGATAGALALLGAVVGTAGAYAALLAWYRSDLSVLGRVPVVDLLFILVGLPVIAGAGGWLLAGREPAGLSRRALE